MPASYNEQRTCDFVSSEKEFSIDAHNFEVCEVGNEKNATIPAAVSIFSIFLGTRTLMSTCTSFVFIDNFISITLLVWLDVAILYILD